MLTPNAAEATPSRFDADFYRTHYADVLGDSDPFAHFVEAGLERGFLPNPWFDPVLYRIRVPQARRVNAWEHYLRHGLGARHAGGLEATFPDALPEFYGTHVTDVEALSMSPAQARALAEPGALTFDWQGATYRFEHPAPEFLFDRIAADLPFAFARIPHGFWDSIFVTATAADRIAADPRCDFASGDACWSLAARLGFERWPGIGNFAENFIREVLADLSQPDDGPEWFAAVAFKGFPTAGDSVFPAEPPGQANLERFQVFATFFPPEARLFDATLWKRWAAAGALARLPDLCRSHSLTVVGPEHLSGLGKRWDHVDARHLAIPPTNSQLQRHDLLARCRTSLDAASGARKPILLFQCGGSLAWWLMARLRSSHPEAIYIDLGQALDAWFFDAIRRDVTPTWVRVFRDHIEAHGR